MHPLDLRRSSLTMLLATSIAVSAAAWAPPSVITSPDGQYSIRMLDEKPLTSGHPYDYDRTIALFHLDQPISRFPTLGFLLDAHWSPDAKFVAVNNRRANSGDYLWVFSLADGKPVKVPEDQSDSNKLGPVGDVFARVRGKLSGYAKREEDRYSIRSTGWKSATEAKVEIFVRFFDAVPVTIHDLYRVEAGSLRRVHERFERGGPSG